MPARTGPSPPPRRKVKGRTKKRILLVSAALILAAGAHSLLWGRLAPISPVVVGFDRRVSPKAIVYFHRGTPIPEADTVDGLIERAEAWHKLRFRAKPQIVICRSDREYGRFTGHAARFKVFPVYGRLFVSSRAVRDAAAGRIHLDVYLAHELSHSLLYQNMSAWRALSYPGWLLEGVAVRSSGQMGIDGYYTKDATFEAIQRGLFVPPDDWGTILRGQRKSVGDLPLENKMWFIYSEFGCLVDRLIENHGEDRFLRFLKETLSSGNYRRLFEQTFGIPFDEFLGSFKNGPAEPGS